MKEQSPVKPSPIPRLEWREFMVEHPPGGRALVNGAAVAQSQYNNSVLIPHAELQLYCYASCKELRFCRRVGGSDGHLFADRRKNPTPYAPVKYLETLPFDAQINYECEKCGHLIKSYGLRFWSVAPSGLGNDPVEVEKVFEWPAFAPQIPAKLFRIGLDRDTFLKARRAEIEGLGIGAFAYYRRLVENQKNQLLTAAIKVARHLSADPETIKALEGAIDEIQFSKAMENVKDVIPPVLYINGYNPFTILHSALSKGLHAESDAECLAASTDIRIILTRLAENFRRAMESEDEINQAVNRIMQKKRN